MSTPLEAPAPDMPTGSSNPVSWKGWFQKIGTWLSGLSPAGAAAYDSGPQAISPNGVFTSSATVRRNGKRVATAGALVASASASFSTTFVKIGTLPSTGTVRPATSAYITVGVFGAGNLQLMFTNGGDINARALTGTVSLVSGASIYLDGLGWSL